MVKVKKKPNGYADRLRALKPGSDECLVAKTARDHQAMLGCFGILREEGMRFTTAKVANGNDINVWRIK